MLVSEQDGSGVYLRLRGDIFMKISFLDLRAQHNLLSGEIAEALQRVMADVAFSGGPFVEQFEIEFAEYCNTSYAIGVGSGTEALWLTLLALGITNGDEVITTSNTFIATAEAISLCGARPVFVDIDNDSYTLNPYMLHNAITSNTKAIIPVHLYGMMANMGPILEIAQKHGIPVVEDACQAHGAEYKGIRAGSLGVAGCFSFYPGKNLGAYGEAGAVVTNNQYLAEHIRTLRDHGQKEKYKHDVIGSNCRMDGIQGAILSVKLKYLEKWNDARINNAKIYNYCLHDLNEIILPKTMDYAKHVYHIFAIRTADRNGLLAHMADKNINCGIHYPIPIHLQKAYSDLGILKGSLPNSEKCSNEIVSLPIYPEMSRDKVEYVSEAIKTFYKNM